VTFVLDSVVYWRSSLGMEAWIKTGAVLEDFFAGICAFVGRLKRNGFKLALRQSCKGGTDGAQQECKRAVQP
jgi:hypothetical protein